MKANPDLYQSNMWQIPVPEDCVNKTFEQLFYYLLDKNLVTIGLYRLRGATDNNYPYVYTNPMPSTIINHKDRAFVLGFDIDDELSTDFPDHNVIKDKMNEKAIAAGERVGHKGGRHHEEEVPALAKVDVRRPSNAGINGSPESPNKSSAVKFPPFNPKRQNLMTGGAHHSANGMEDEEDKVLGIS